MSTLKLSENEKALLGQLARFHAIQPMPEGSEEDFYGTMYFLLSKGASLHELLSAYQEGKDSGDYGTFVRLVGDNLLGTPGSATAGQMDHLIPAQIEITHLMINGILNNPESRKSIEAFPCYNVDEIPAIFLNNDWSALRPLIVTNKRSLPYQSQQSPAENL
ncbi:MAG: hypothetical protein H7844_13840 [Nitrospirae bacterium YQR-1]